VAITSLPPESAVNLLLLEPMDLVFECACRLLQHGMETIAQVADVLTGLLDTLGVDVLRQGFEEFVRCDAEGASAASVHA
jgi:hypothetical protein